MEVYDFSLILQSYHKANINAAPTIKPTMRAYLAEGSQAGSNGSSAITADTYTVLFLIVIRKQQYRGCKERSQKMDKMIHSAKMPLGNNVKLRHMILSAWT